jgi:eukaryotic-like serine/threonine-protein kinase
MTPTAPERRTVILRDFSGAATEESRAFLQQRLATTAAVWAALSFGFLVITTLISLFYWSPEYGAGYVTQPAFAFHLASTMLVAGIWLYTRRGRVPEASLATIDAFGISVAGLLIALMGATMPMGEGTIHALLAVCFLLFVRAVALPSTARRTLFVSLGTSTVVTSTIALVGSSFWGMRHISQGRIMLGERVTYFGLWLLAATAVATFASKIIFGLQQEVRQARQIGQYVLKQKIGEGGMGVVYLATHAMLRRDTAIKMLLPGKVAPEALARFEREVRQLARLNHPNTVAIYDYGRTPDGVFYYAMEFLEGLDLDQLVSALGPLPPGRVVHLLEQICASLAEAHEMGLVHRDIKPANVLVSCHGGIPDAVKVLDFGLVKDVQSVNDVSLTAAEGFLGTPLYTSPEAIRNPDAVTAASDIYAVAALGYYLLTASHVAKAATLLEVCVDHLYGNPERPSARLGAPIPEALEEVILHGLAKAPGDRPASARALARALRACPGVGAWTEDDARAWWSSKGRELLELRKRRDAVDLE